MKNKYLDTEEENAMKIWEDIDLSEVPNDTANSQRLKAAARSYAEKNETKMNIRISAAELQKIKARAEAEGLKYQTFIKSVLHRYLTGQLVDRGHTVTS